MDDRRVLITISHISLEAARSILEEAGIIYFILDQTDTAHAASLGGDIQIYVKEVDESEARKLLKEAGLN